MSTVEKNQLTIGFMPLSDCAPLVVAQELGYFSQQGLNVRLSRQNSWATLRDKLHAGLLDMAQMLAPMPLASQLGLGVASEDMCVPMVLSYNGNAITLASDLYAQVLHLNDVSADVVMKEAMSAALLLPLIAKRKETAQEKLRFATVFPFSCHYYQLVGWLSAGGVDLEDVEISIIPPAGMVDALLDKQIDGFCVGSPWNAAAVRTEVGVTVIASNEIWHNTPEKVLGLTAVWRDQHPHTLNAVLFALQRACDWLTSIPNRFEAARWLAQAQYVGTSLDIVTPALIDSCLTSAGHEPRTVKGHTLFSIPNIANKATTEQGIWLLQQMERCGHLSSDIDREALASKVFRGE